MDHTTKAATFAALHRPGAPLVLHNAWDAGSARAVAEAGAPAVASGSWAVAAAMGFEDGEALPMADALRVAQQMARTVRVPVSFDFEGGYGSAPQEVAQNAAALVETGVVGLNFEDRIVQGEGLYGVQAQADRIAAMRAMADAKGLPLFINARTDVFFQGSKAAPDALFAEAMTRAQAYAKAGANGIFVPGLGDLPMIQRLCRDQPLPVNVMRGGGQSLEALAKAGVARISHGPAPYLAAMKAVTDAAQALR